MQRVLTTHVGSQGTLYLQGDPHGFLCETSHILRYPRNMFLAYRVIHMGAVEGSHCPQAFFMWILHMIHSINRKHNSIFSFFEIQIIKSILKVFPTTNPTAIGRRVSPGQIDDNVYDSNERGRAEL